LGTIEGNATVTPDGKLTVQVPPDVPPGEHHVVVQIDEKPATKTGRPEITFAAHDVGPWPDNYSVKREDLYDE